MIELKTFCIQRLSLSPNIEYLFFNSEVIGIKICDKAYCSYSNMESIFKLEGWEEVEIVSKLEVDKMVEHLEELLDLAALRFLGIAC